MLASMLPAYPPDQTDVDVAGLQSLLQSISLGDARGLPPQPCMAPKPQQQQHSADVTALLQELNHYNNLQSAITILRLTAALNQNASANNVHHPSAAVDNNAALQLQLLLAQQQQQEQQRQRQQQQQAALLLATIDPSLAGLDVGALVGLCGSPTSTTAMIPQQHRPKTRRGTRGKGRGRKKNVTARAPTWAGSDWSPRQGVAAAAHQQECGTGVFIPGSPNARSDSGYSDDDGSESGRSDASRFTMVLPECPWY